MFLSWQSDYGTSTMFLTVIFPAFSAESYLLPAIALIDLSKKISARRHNIEVQKRTNATKILDWLCETLVPTILDLSLLRSTINGQVYRNASMLVLCTSERH